MEVKLTLLPFSPQLWSCRQRHVQFIHKISLFWYPGKKKKEIKMMKYLKTIYIHIEI